MNIFYLNVVVTATQKTAPIDFKNYIAESQWLNALLKKICDVNMLYSTDSND